MGAFIPAPESYFSKLLGVAKLLIYRYIHRHAYLSPVSSMDEFWAVIGKRKADTQRVQAKMGIS